MIYQNTLFANLGIVGLACLLLSTSTAAPVADDERVPIDLRRTTLVVQDIESSLSFYRDALGMEVIYDRNIRTPRDAPSDAEAELARRLVFLRANDTYIGVLGLLQYTNPVKPAPHQGDTPFSTGSIVLLFNADDVESTFARARAVNGVRAISEPTLTEYPSYDGTGTIKVMVSVLTDPDGFVIELNQLLTDPLE
jgi:catechol 2,3-dioxygenase-like lactoylglutathione lyase family enzyme